jgi:hypothetical protein
LPESPRWLVEHNREADAKKVRFARSINHP